MRLRFAAVAAPDAPPRIDRQARVIYGVSMLQAGVEALGHDCLIDEIMLAQCVEQVNAAGDQGIKARFTHPGLCADGLGRMLGRVRNARVVGDKAVADLHLADHATKTPDGDLATYVMDLAEQDPKAFGLSIAFEGSRVWKTAAGAEFPVSNESGDRAPRPADATTDQPFARITKLFAVDAVDEPAANRDGLFAAAFAATTSTDAAAAFAALDQIRERLGVTPDQAREFLGRYLSARKDTPMSKTSMSEGEKPAAQAEKPTACATCGAPIDGEGKYTAPAPAPTDKPMEPAAMSALCKAHPTQAPLIAERFAAGASESAIRAELAAGRVTDLEAQVKTLGEQLAAEKTAHQAVAAKYAKLSALAGTAPQDPGTQPVEIGPEKTGDALKARWSAMSSEQRSVYAGSFDAFAFHILNDAGTTAGGEK